MIMMMPGEKQYKFEEILPIYKAVNSETDVGTFADFMEAFKTFDREGQGYIAAAELRHVLTSLGKQPVSSTPQICINTHPDAVPPIHAVSYHVATDKPPPAQDGDKFRSIFSDNIQPIATRGKKARGTLLVNQHCGNGCSMKRAPLSVSYYNEISGGHIERGGVVRRRCSAGPVLPLWSTPSVSK